MVINHPTVLKFSIFDFGPLMYGSNTGSYRDTRSGNGGGKRETDWKYIKVCFSCKGVPWARRSLKDFDRNFFYRKIKTNAGKLSTGLKTIKTFVLAPILGSFHALLTIEANTGDNDF